MADQQSGSGDGGTAATESLSAGLMSMHRNEDNTGSSSSSSSSSSSASGIMNHSLKKIVRPTRSEPVPMMGVPHHSGIMNHDNISKGLKGMKFEVRGAIYNAAVKRMAEGKNVLFLNVGNPHALNQKPLTFMRQVLALIASRRCA